jgi:general secretion pathway protein K
MASYSVRTLASRLRQPGRPMSGSNNRRKRGSALLLVLFAIILLSGLITATVQFVRIDVDEYAALNKDFRARQLAESGLAFGTNPKVENSDKALLEQRAPDGGQFRVVISSESTKLNINTVLDTNRDDLLENLFGTWGVEQKVAQTAVDGLHDYLDKQAPAQPAATNLQAAAANSQAGTANLQAQPFGPQFRSVEEMSLVPEFAPVMKAQPGWMDYFTIWGDGKIDVNLADAGIIALVTGVSQATADNFVKYRWGPDGKPDTPDDRVYTSMDEVRAALGMSPDQFQLVQNLLTLNSEIDRIESTGIIAGYEKRIVVVTSRNAVPIAYLSWQEN